MGACDIVYMLHNIQCKTQGRGERYKSMSSCTGPLRPKNEKNRFERYGQKPNENKKCIKGVMLWAADVCSRAAFAQSGSVSSITLCQFFSVRRG